MTAYQSERDAALEFANMLRARLGKKPVKRLRKGSHWSDDCPLARTINRGGNVRVTREQTRLDNRLNEPPIENPALVHAFIAHFDAGLLPDLELKQ